MKYLQTLFFLSFICCNTIIVSAQITIDDTYTAQQLIENVLVNSTCATVSNFSATGDNSIPFGQNSYGYFTKGTSNFPFTEGVLLSTSYAKKSIGPFDSNLTNIIGNDNDSAWSGDADLNLALGITTSVTATVLEFDFTPLTNFLSFDYIFASNEYSGTGSCNYTDGFAFLIKENLDGATYKNLAVIPGTALPVSSTNIRPIISGTGGCAAVNQTYFNGFNDSTSPINYAAQTVVMNAQTNVVAGKSYHIKLVIANDKNEFYDSAIFLKAGSFAPKIDLGPDRLLTSNPICSGETFTIDTTLPATYIYKWYKDGTEIIGETSPNLTVTETADYKVEVLLATDCTATDEIKIEFAPEIVLSNTSLAQCDDNNDGITIFDLTKVDNIIKNNDTSLSTVEYYESSLEADGKTNKINNPTAYQNRPVVTTIYARVSNNPYNCYKLAKVNLVIANNNITAQELSTCDGDGIQDGLYQFDLNAKATPQILTGLPTGMIVEYYLNNEDALAQKNALPTTIFKNTINPQTIYARIVNGPDCYGVIPITLSVSTFSPTNFKDTKAGICSGSSAILSVPAGFSSYLWNTGETSDAITVTTAGNYAVTVTDSNGCEAVKKFIVSESEIGTITGATVTDFAGNQNSVLLDYTGSGDYEFSLDGSYYQDDPLITGVAPGLHLAYVRDKNGCGVSAPYEVYVLDYPRFFTPNGDGYNDLWKIKNLDLFPKAVLTIFNRYGKLLQQLNANNLGWDGLYIGSKLPSDDYWFRINFGDGKIIKGHFSLKR